MTFAIRFRAEQTPWGEGSLFAWKAPSLDKSKTSPLDRRGFNLAVMPFSTFRLLGAMVDQGGKREGRFVAMPLFEFIKFDEAGWHDAVVRVQGRRTELFVDGKLRDRHDVPAVYAQESSFFPEPAARTSSWCGIGADPGGRYPFRGAVDHVAIWHRALDDREIAALSGGKLDASWDLPTGWAQLATLPRLMSLADRNRWIDAQMERALPEMVAHDPWFPKYDVAIPGDSYNFVAFCHRGLYHFFPIFNFGWWGTLLMSDGCAWAHLVSDDLLHWKLLPQLPKESFGANGCIAAQGDKATVFAGWGPDSLARPTRHGMHYLRSRDADLRSWTADPANPVVMPDPPDWHGEDCTVLREGDEWWMIASSAKPNKQGRRSKQMHLFTSPALRDWKYAGVFFEVEADFAPECVHAFRLGGKLVLAGCQRMRRDLQYYVGRVENRRFIPETHGLWNHSAAEGIPTAVWTVEDNQGRRILWQWLEGRHFFNIGNLSVKERFKAGWDQAYSVPMLVSQRDDGTLALAPVPELEELRGAHFSQTAAKLPAGKSLTLRAGADANTGPATLLSPSVKKANGSDRSVAGPGCGAQQEVLVEIEPQPNAETGLRLTQAAEFAEIFYRAATSEMVLDFTKTAHGLTFPKKVMTFPLPLKPGEPLMLRVFLDGCLIEGFANGGRYFNARWYAPAPRDIQFSTFSRGADALLRRADVWTLKSATMTCQ